MYKFLPDAVREKHNSPCFLSAKFITDILLGKTTDFVTVTVFFMFMFTEHALSH